MSGREKLSLADTGQIPLPVPRRKLYQPVARGKRLVPTSDGSNVRKLIEDALGTDRTKGWRLYSDDNQVAAGETIQVYAASTNDGPCTEVVVARC